MSSLATTYTLVGTETMADAALMPRINLSCEETCLLCMLEHIVLLC